MVCFSLKVYLCLHGYLRVCALSRVRLFVTPWTVYPTRFSIHGIFQARTLEWVAISYFRGVFLTQE